MEHPLAPALAVGGAGDAFDHVAAIEGGHGEFGSSDVDGESCGSGSKNGPAGPSLSAISTSMGVAMPVPFFMIVMDETILPNRSASSGDLVMESARAAPAEKLSPAPQISTGLSTVLVGTHRDSPSRRYMAPLGPPVTTSIGAFVTARSLSRSTAPNARRHASPA